MHENSDPGAPTARSRLNLWWLLLSLVWWSGTSAIPSPGAKRSATPPQPPEPPPIKADIALASKPNEKESKMSKTSHLLPKPQIDSKETKKFETQTKSTETNSKGHKQMTNAEESISDIPELMPNTAEELWKCPEIDEQPVVECSCDMPHTLRCTGDKSAMLIIAQKLRSLRTASISLLDCTVQNVTSISAPFLEGIALHGLVISSGEIKEISSQAFQGLTAPLQALGLPNNQLISVPTVSLKYLPELDRLDLSGNKLRNLDGGSFKGLRNLSFIDISNNQLSKISPNAFDNLPQLKIIRLRGNHLNLQSINKINNLPMIYELDLSENSLTGPLGPKTFSKMENLQDLQLAHNTLTSIKNGALQGLPNLTSLHLEHNLIDVIEDHAFIHLSKLVNLNLAHNRIVAVSGASLAHLNKLTDLDLRHNYLRALTADLIQPLKALKNLKLDENEITIVASDALKPYTIIKHLSMSDNPLNCDCSLIEFSNWLVNSSLNREDKKSATCATPPSLENGLLVEIPTDHLMCGDEEQESSVAPISSEIKTKIILNKFEYDGATIKLTWEVQNKISYSCDAIFVYEEEGRNEILLESNPIQCNSSEMSKADILEIKVPASLELQNGHKYRYCIALFEYGKGDDVSVIPGCSELIPLIKNAKIQESDYQNTIPKIVSVDANLSSYGDLSINIILYPQIKFCELNVIILDQNHLLYQKKLNCNQPKYIFGDLQHGPYRVCANVVRHPSDILKPRCVTVFQKEIQSKFSNLDITFASIFFVLCLVIIGLIWRVRKILLKSKIQTHQCFLPPENEGDVQHNKYVKLQATTKL